MSLRIFVGIIGIVGNAVEGIAGIESVGSMEGSVFMNVWMILGTDGRAV